MSVQGSDEKTTQNVNIFLSQYLEKTLGVTSILNQFQEKKFSETDLGFFIEGYETYSPEENDLLLKMIQAMKLKPNQFQIFNLSEKNTVHSKLKTKQQVCFVDNPKNDTETFSARTLLKKPELKKQTWDFLKSIMNQI